MLKFMRDHLGKTFLVIIVIAISAVFIFMGVFPDSGMSGSAAGTVATVGGEKITARQFLNVANREVESYRAMGMELPPELLQNVRMGTLQRMVQGKLLVSEARRLGIAASDPEVQQEIRQIPNFQDPQTKTFNVNLYRKVLADNDRSTAEFEEEVREQLTLQRMQKFLEDRIRVTPKEVEREFKVANETRNISFIRFSREDAMKKITVADKEVDAFLADKNREAQINGFYAQNNLTYNQPEKVCARHILKRAAPGQEVATTAPKEFLALKPTPANFAELAKKNSDDPGSKANGGDLDCFARGAMDKAFEAAAFSLPVGKVSEPVKSQFGWHYILVSKKEAPVNVPLANVRREIASELIKRERVEDIRKLNLALAEEAAKSWAARGGKLETGSFNSLEGSIPKIGRADEILKAAFDPAAPIQKGPQIFESQGGVIVASIKERKSADMAKFSAEREKQGATLRERKLRAFVPAWLEDVQKRTKVTYNTGALGNLQ